MVHIQSVTRWNVATLSDLESAIVSLKAHAMEMGVSSPSTVFLKAGYNICLTQHQLTDGSVVCDLELIEIAGTRSEEVRT